MYDTCIKIQEVATVRNASGEATDVWSDYADVMAERTHKSGGMNRIARQLANEDEVVYSIRWLPGIKQGMRVLDTGTGDYYNLLEVVPEGRAFNLHLRCHLSFPDNH